MLSAITQPLVILGGTGPSGAPFIAEFIRNGVPVRVLARRPEEIRQRFPQAEIAAGSMFNQEDVRRAMEASAGALLLTPLGGNDDVSGEVRSAEVAIGAAAAAQLPHLMYVSVLVPATPAGVPPIDVKQQVEGMLARSGLPWSSLRAGGYMEDNFDRIVPALRYGIFPSFPSPSLQTHYTAQRDIARAAVALVERGVVLNGGLDVIDPTPYTAEMVTKLIERISGRSQLRIPAPLMQGGMALVRPILRQVNPKGVTITSIVGFLATNTYLGDPEQLGRVLPGFTPTTLEVHLRELLNAPSATAVRA